MTPPLDLDGRASVPARARDDWSPTAMLSEMGVSIWLDGLARPILDDASFDRLVVVRDVVGATTTPDVVARALMDTGAYGDELQALSLRGIATDDVIAELLMTDAQRAGCALDDVFRRSHGVDGRVTVEVEPVLAHDAAGTAARARQLRERVGRENAMVGIPATLEGLDAITATIASGIDVNATLLFSVDRYRAVIRAYLLGLEQAEASGMDLAMIHSVASFSVAPMDAEVDRRLTALHFPNASALLRRAGVANACLAYRVYREEFSTTRALRLLARGARPQRLLWTSTGAEEGGLPDTHYVTELIAPGTVSAMPHSTLEAVADHGVIASDNVTGRYKESADVLGTLESVGVPYSEVTRTLEKEGVRKSVAAWQTLRGAVRAAAGSRS